MKRILNQFGRLILAGGVFLYVVFEELVWDLIAQPIYQYLRALRILQIVEAKIVTLEPHTLLILFLALFIQGEGLSILALASLAQGNPVLGVGVYLVKLPVAAFTFWLFRISKHILMTFAWFKYGYEVLMRIIDYIKASSIHKNMVTLVIRVKCWLKNKTKTLRQWLSSIKTVLIKQFGFQSE